MAPLMLAYVEIEMKSRVWCVALVGAGLALLTAANSLRLRGGQGSPTVRDGVAAPRPDVVLWSGPDVDAIKRKQAKDRMVQEIITGQKSLLESAALLRRLDDLSPRWVRATDRFPDAASEEEAYCRAVIAYVGAEVAPNWANQITTTLQAELHAGVRDGTLHFNSADADLTVPEAHEPSVE
jgi:hypothetical protein